MSEEKWRRPAPPAEETDPGTDGWQSEVMKEWSLNIANACKAKESLVNALNVKDSFWRSKEPIPVNKWSVPLEIKEMGFHVESQEANDNICMLTTNHGVVLIGFYMNEEGKLVIFDPHRKEGTDIFEFLHSGGTYTVSRDNLRLASVRSRNQVSRPHCKITFTKTCPKSGTIKISDLNSKNGTQIYMMKPLDEQHGAPIRRATRKRVKRASRPEQRSADNTSRRWHQTAAQRVDDTDYGMDMPTQ